MFGFETYFIFAIIVITLWLAWVNKYGLLRGSLATVARLCWMLPLILALFPKTYYQKIAASFTLKPLYVLIDDSSSMQNKPRAGKSYLEKAEEFVSGINHQCQLLGCTTKVYHLSELDSYTSQGYTPLIKALESWIFGLSGMPWILLSDGGDYLPQTSLENRFLGLAAHDKDKSRGLIVGFKPAGYKNIWIKEDKTPIISFSGKPTTIPVGLKRESSSLEQETVQIQVGSDGNTLATSNATFAKGEEAIEVVVKIPPVAKGRHLIVIKALPTPDEFATWDNTSYRNLDVMPNTVGILHLLGSPGWDGRYLRRYLKSEPKYDLISFFILRDPNNTQVTSERDLSLIPFPRERLFNEELPNFNCIIIQNFALFKFLLPAYQQNLVNYVKNGGSILFIGGPRALHAGDYSNQDFAAILPFVPPVTSASQTEFRFLDDGDQQDELLGYNESQQYRIEFAEPTPQQRLLASVFDEWKGMESSLQSQKDLTGLHDLSHVTFKKEGVTPLLLAKLSNGKSVPLAAASYPGKGRAIWIFSDSFYKLALSPGVLSSSTVYQSFFESAINWLMHRESEKSLVISDLEIGGSPDEFNQWLLHLRGPAARYLRSGGVWQLSICSVPYNLEEATIEAVGPEDWVIKGRMNHKLVALTKCDVAMEATHPAFGSATARASTIVPQVYKDKDIGEAPNILAAIGTRLDAKLLWEQDSTIQADASKWLEDTIGQSDLTMPAKFETVKDHYWVLQQPWFWLLLACLPLEVVIRRWKQLGFFDY